MPDNSSPSKTKFRFGSKAETLQSLQARVTLCKVPALAFYSLADWRRDPAAIMSDITLRFPTGPLVIRSSAVNEDGALDSMAGRFISVVNVDAADRAAVASAISRVYDSYDTLEDEQQVLIQAMVTDLDLIGVALTRDHQTGSPYIIINYDDESGRVDTVTGGSNASKSLLIHRSADRAWVKSDRIRRLLEAISEVEALTGSDRLDIEIALDQAGTVWLLQVRPITTSRHWDPEIDQRVKTILQAVDGLLARRDRETPHLMGTRSLYGDMPDWNPAEIIGANPAPLAFSLYRSLITRSVWREARTLMGYADPTGEELMVSFAGHPFIDIRNSFHSFLPAQLDCGIGGKLVDAWLDRLAAHPEYHDKVEFDVAATCLVPGHDAILEAHYPGLLTEAEADLWRTALREVTNSAITDSCTASLAWCTQEAETLKRLQDLQPLSKLNSATRPNHLRYLQVLIEQCRRFGTLPFAAAARHAFIAESILRRLVAMGALPDAKVTAHKATIKTVAGEIADMLAAARNGSVAKEAFLREYGHLRPGTYDICSPRYDQMTDLFDAQGTETPRRTEMPSFTREECAAAQALLDAAGLTITFQQFLVYHTKATQERERLKMIFTRHISDILEVVADYGVRFGLDRQDMSMITLEDLDILTHKADSDLPYVADFLITRAAEGRSKMRRNAGVKLTYLISGPEDLRVVPLQRAHPNFVTKDRVMAKVSKLDARDGFRSDLFGKLICIENADPGFDWIFGCNIAGLITKYGGANSHMAIRCAEFGTPAAIGCGEQLFVKLSAASRIDLDCAAGTIRPVAP